MRKALKADHRKIIFERDNFTCKICKIKPSVIPINYDGKNTLMIGKRWLELDHIKPYSLGGSCDTYNLQTLCNTCNSKKYNKWQS